MKNLISVLLIVIPFLVTSCNQKQNNGSKTDLKSIIKSNSSTSSIQWVDVSQLETLMAKEPRKVFFYFFREGCPYCKEMKETTFQDGKIIKTLNEKFYAVMINGRSKEDIVFNGITYKNPEKDPKIRSNHDLHKVLVDPYQGNFYWPSVVFLNEKFEKLRSYPGLQKPEQFKRILSNMQNR
jgi:thioredoxin-related protein